MKRALLLIPTYNEAQNIESLVSAITRAMRNNRTYKYDVLFIDDNSPDGTASLVKEATGVHPELHLLSGKKAGLGQAYIRGMRWGLRASIYDTFVMIDTDLSHDPAEIPSLLARIEDGADYVIGFRYVSGGGTNRRIIPVVATCRAWWPTVWLPR